PELSDPEIIVGPDNIITTPRIGNINVGNRTREDVVAEITEKLRQFYESPEVTLTIKQYKNNKAYVLGRVENPGVVTFAGQGTLLEALSLAGGLPVLEKEAFLTKCAIIRGNHKIIWIDLRELLNNGNMALNARIMNNDVIFIPESDDENVYVMGEVIKPGAIRLRLQMAFLDALMLAGGPTHNANLKQIHILRFDGETSEVRDINLKQMLKTGNLGHNFQLKANDIVYVAPNGVSRFNYALKQLMPFLEVLNLSVNNLEGFGVMQELRKELWGQEGFVSQ
ncbi:SLBB domain-containing protein, partial [Desulfobacterales bacterium HSG17]|nr:SLBB domain-containing protein [Desulfobacterales bacterium HSG17]